MGEVAKLHDNDGQQALFEFEGEPVKFLKAALGGGGNLDIDKPMNRGDLVKIKGSGYVTSVTVQGKQGAVHRRHVIYLEEWSVQPTGKRRAVAESDDDAKPED